MLTFVPFAINATPELPTIANTFFALKDTGEPFSITSALFAKILFLDTALPVLPGINNCGLIGTGILDDKKLDEIISEPEQGENDKRQSVSGEKFPDKTGHRAEHQQQQDTAPKYRCG